MEKRKATWQGETLPGFDFRTDDIPETETKKQGPCQKGKRKNKRPQSNRQNLHQVKHGVRNIHTRYEYYQIFPHWSSPTRLSLTMAIGGRERASMPLWSRRRSDAALPAMPPISVREGPLRQQGEGCRDPPQSAQDSSGAQFHAAGWPPMPQGGGSFSCGLLCCPCAVAAWWWMPRRGTWRGLVPRGFHLG